jgi:hypothetical protein
MERIAEAPNCTSANAAKTFRNECSRLPGGDRVDKIISAVFQLSFLLLSILARGHCVFYICPHFRRHLNWASLVRGTIFHPRSSASRKVIIWWSYICVVVDRCLNQRRSVNDPPTRLKSRTHFLRPLQAKPTPPSASARLAFLSDPAHLRAVLD